MFVNSNLEMLMSREQLINDIVNIVDEHFPSPNLNDLLIEELCDAVCRNFPAK